ncbi:hypothetical protein EV360DRAFT_83903 [Lentinula raphanica]|nr:hypothetical protein EV360DRAFT_83903 [Lentinula raphanica]
MTRTARASFPRAIIKDRSQSRSGSSGKVMKKEGAGSHNWGRIDEMPAEDEPDYESEGEPGRFSTGGLSLDSDDDGKPAHRKRTLSLPNLMEIEAAKQFRKNALNGGVDLAAIARTSIAVSASSKDATNHTGNSNAT